VTTASLRRGDPDKADHFGNTALHFAAARGHMSCVTFLVNFGANLWALDIDYHTPKELAAMNSKDDILRFLDGVAAKEEASNK
jgi:ankyrin repeat protein